MKYFSTEESKKVVENADAMLFVLCDDNPNYEAMKLLSDRASEGNSCDNYWIACIGFALGRATGIREERERRKKATK